MAQKDRSPSNDVALHFVNKSGVRATPAMYSKTNRQAQSLLDAGYTKEEIIACIDYFIDVEKVDMYSLGYLSFNIASAIKKIRQSINKKLADEQRAMHTIVETKEVEYNNESAERNKKKASELGSQSGFGKKFAIDLSSTTRQDS